MRAANQRGRLRAAFFMAALFRLYRVAIHNACVRTNPGDPLAVRAKSIITAFKQPPPKPAGGFLFLRFRDPYRPE
jgi:hypothetical protein